MKFFYQAGAMGYFGEGWFWHKYVKGGEFPKLPFVTKSITIGARRGYPFAVMRFGQSTWNKISLHNMGFSEWVNLYSKSGYENSDRLILSLFGTDNEIEIMVGYLEFHKIPLAGIELNFSCPNSADLEHHKLPDTSYPIYLKLRYNQDPYKFDLDKVKRIHMNTVPMFKGGVGGKMAQNYNWNFIMKFGFVEGLPVAGASWTNRTDLQCLRNDLGCTDFGIGSVIITRPRWVKNL